MPTHHAAFALLTGLLAQGVFAQSAFQKPMNDLSRGYAAVAAIHTPLAHAMDGDLGIILDGRFDDWRSVPLTYEDATRDANGAVDFGRLAVTGDGAYLYLYLEVGGDVTLQEANPIELYVDVDGDPKTGHPIGGIGAEWMYAFGARKGKTFAGHDEGNLQHVCLGLISAPSVSSSAFELAIGRNASAGGQPLLGEHMRLLFTAGERTDRLPDEPGGVPVHWQPHTRSALPGWSMAKADGTHFRLVTYNVSSDRLFLPAARGAYERILKTLNPDILAIQEVRRYTSAQTMNRLGALLPEQTPLRYHQRLNSDVTLISRYPILESVALSDNTAFLLATDGLPSDRLLLVVTSMPCCFADEPRQQQVEQIAAFIEEAKQPGGRLTIPPRTPVIVTGDMNFVGKSRQLTTLLNGMGVEGPDWGGPSLVDLTPGTTGLPFTFTWINNKTDFTPGRLDYICYTGSVLEVNNDFALYTPGLTTDQLTELGLRHDDSDTASDHLPVVADFRIK